MASRGKAAKRMEQFEIQIIERQCMDFGRSGELIIAAADGCIKDLSKLLNNGVDVDGFILIAKFIATHDRTHITWNALLAASHYGRERAVQVILCHGANINLANDHGWTALHMASKQGHRVIVKLLLQCGANVNIQDKDRRTALSWASQNGHVGVVELLLESGADHTPPNVEGATALIWACFLGNVDVVLTLLQWGADHTYQDPDGNTALHVACLRRPAEALQVAEVLLRHGADPSIINKHGLAPFDYVVGEERLRMLELQASVEAMNWVLK